MLNVGVTYLQTIHKDLEKEEPVVKSTLAHAEELLGTSNQSKKVEKDQQYQKLRYNTSDLKVRFDAASNEAETRTKKFDDLYEDLEDFYNTVEELDQWMDTAIEKGHSIKVSEQDPEVQYELFQKHVEELKAKESEISELVKLADKFRDDTQEFMNGVDRYRKHVHILPTIKEETEESAMIDDEIEALEEKFRDITQKCTRYLEKLFSVVKHRKGFTELANKLATIYPDLDSKISVIDEESSAKSPKEMTQSKSVIKKLDNLNSWVSVTEELLSSKSPICLDKEKLEEHLHEQRRIHGDVGSYRALLENLSKEAHDMDGAEEKLAVLDERMENLEKLSNNRILELEGVIGNIEDLEDQMNDLKSWLTTSIDSIHKKPKGTSHNSHLFKAKIDALYAEKKGKESDMDSIKQLAKQIMQTKNVSNGYQLKEAVAGVQEQWHELTELLVQEVSLEALSEIESMLRYMDKAENEINTAEPVSSDPETLTIQLRDHKVFHNDLNSKRNSVKDIISKCNRMLRETTNTQTEAIKSRLDSIQTQADIVCQLSSDRLQHLESALPLASHFSENQAEILAWLDEMEAELKAQSTSGENLDQVKKQLDNLKVTQQIIEDHKPFVEDLSDTGMELIELCGDEDAEDLQGKLSSISTRYDSLKTQAREKAHDLNENRKLMTQEVSDTLENLLEDLAEMEQSVMNADPIPALPEKLRDEIDENKRIMERLHKHHPHVDHARESVAGIVSQGVEDEDEIEEMKTKVMEICKLSEDVSSAALERDRQLNQARKMSTKFYDLCSEVGCSIKDLKENLYSQEPPGIDSPTIKEQQKELTEINRQQDKAVASIKDCHRFGEKLSALCGDPGKIEVQKQLEDLDNMAEDLNDVVTERSEELNLALGHAYQFQVVLDAIMSWLPVSQHKLSTMKSPSTDKSVLKDQIEELKLFKMQTHPHVTDVDSLNQHMTALNDLSPVAAESLLKPVDDVNERWKDLLRGIADREACLHQTQVKVGELEHAIESIMSNLENSKKDLGTLDNIIGDPKCIETQMKKLQLIQDDLKNQSSNVSKLNKTVSNLTSTTQEESNSSLQDKTLTMNKLLREVQVSARDHENKLQETLREVKKFTGDVDDMLHWVNDLRMELKSKSPFGALPEAAKSQLENFQKRCIEVEMKEDGVKSLLLNGQDMIDRCRPEDVRQLSEKLRKLKDRWYETKNRALRRRDKMQGHLKNVEDFHNTLKEFTDWLNNAETTMRTFKYPSKLVGKVQNQIEEHNNLLVGIRLRWKKLLRRTDERGRLLNQAFSEDKRFYESWKNLCDWLDSSEKMLSSFLTPQSQTASNGQSTKMKEDMEELKKKPVDMDTQINQLLRVKLFQHQLAAKHPSYYSTTRLGRNLKDRCTKIDNDRNDLQTMLDQLKNKWNLVRSVVSKSQNKLDEALLTSGRVSDALNSLQEWLSKAETTLSEDLPILGDYDTVNLLIEQHKSVQQELIAREQTLEAVKSAGNIPDQHLDELIALWNKINILSENRETRLKEALTLAEEFQEVVQVMREFLPTAESELKFRPLPDDEFAIIHLIERHEKFQEQLRNHQDAVDKIKTLAEEILLNCHPNAIRFVKYYLTITQTRWDQLVQRARSRAQRLQEALKSIQGNAALLEELLAWLTDAQVLLATKEKDPIPHDLNVVETLLKEHLELHEEVTSKNADVDRLTKIVTCESKLSQGRHYGSNWKLNEMDGHNPRVITLQNKWRTVWRMSVDRKKKLQDALDTLLELESFKNFNFDLWRQRYLNWIQEKKFRITDFFRRQDKDCDGALTRKEFVDGMLQSKFPTNKTELNAVFDLFDTNRTGRIDYRNFTDAMKPDRHKTSRMKTGKRQATDSEMIHDEIERQISTCQCRHQFKAERIDEGQYRFGENLKLKLVRFLNSCVMVRVGGGWVTLEQFLETNDPCRAKGRTTTELRESFVLAEGVAQSRTAFRSKTPDPLSKKRLSEGYASSNSSGSTGSLSRSKRLSSSSNSLSSTKSPRNPKTPVTSNTRPKTPTANSKSSQGSGTSTPVRPRSVTPNPTRSVTPNPIRMGAQRRLPTTPKTPTRPKTPTTR
ncbi:DST [Acanthosepion pharaonis]|uniref:DST n=1 Tax=Acanthosepion pharaonis TaxID=158019 RepID=A0A812E2E4_ACAPH|nr:DST [Sepia pharaonis]